MREWGYQQRQNETASHTTGADLAKALRLQPCRETRVLGKLLVLVAARARKLRPPYMLQINMCPNS